MFATLSTAWVLPGVIGPAIAGVVAETFHWRLVFLGLLPLIAVAGAHDPAGHRRRSGRPTEPADARERGVDRPGGGCRWRSSSRSAPGLLVAGLTDARLVPGAAARRRRASSLGVPAFRRLTPPGTLGPRRGLPAAVLLRGVLTFAFFAADAYVPLALQGWRGTSATVAGLALTAAT